MTFELVIWFLDGTETHALDTTCRVTALVSATTQQVRQSWRVGDFVVVDETHHSVCDANGVVLSSDGEHG
jgi:hypothetical protein